MRVLGLPQQFPMAEEKATKAKYEVCGCGRIVCTCACKAWSSAVHVLFGVCERTSVQGIRTVSLASSPRPSYVGRQASGCFRIGRTGSRKGHAVRQDCPSESGAVVRMSGRGNACTSTLYDLTSMSFTEVMQYLHMDCRSLALSISRLEISCGRRGTAALRTVTSSKTTSKMGRLFL